MHEGEWMTFAMYLERRFGLLTTQGISPKVIEKLPWEDQAPAGGALEDPRRLAAVRATGLLDAPLAAGFDRITRLGAAALSVPATFISLVEDHRDFYLSHCGFGEPLVSERQVTGQTFCHFTIQGERPLIIPDTRADPPYSKVPTVESLGHRQGTSRERRLGTNGHGRSREQRECHRGGKESCAHGTDSTTGRGHKRLRSAPASPSHRQQVYQYRPTGSPSTSIFGVTPSPGVSGAAMRPFTRCGAPSAMDTVT
jgi:hypothetical protein